MDIQLANKLNKQIIKTAKTKNEKDLARMRLNIIKKAKRRKRNEKR